MSLGVLTLTSSGFTLPNPAVTLRDEGFSELWIPTLEGDNVEGADGHIAYPRTIKQQRASVPVLIDSAVDLAGDPTVSPSRGMWDNLQGLIAALVLPTTEGDGAQEVALVPFLDGPLLTGRMQFPAVVPGKKVRAGWLAVIDVVLPDGPLEESS